VNATREWPGSFPIDAMMFTYHRRTFPGFAAYSATLLRGRLMTISEKNIDGHGVMIVIVGVEGIQETWSSSRRRAAVNFGRKTPAKNAHRYLWRVPTLRNQSRLYELILSLNSQMAARR
jgi:hypothetical protein